MCLRYFALSSPSDSQAAASTVQDVELDLRARSRLRRRRARRWRRRDRGDRVPQATRLHLSSPPRNERDARRRSPAGRRDAYRGGHDCRRARPARAEVWLPR